MNKWLQRALISAGAAVVSTTAVITTAESSDGKKRKKRKKDKKREKDGSHEGRGADGALIDDSVPRSIGAQAAHDYRSGHDGGLTASELVENVKGLGTKARDGVSTLGGLLFGKAPAPPAGAPAGEGGKAKKKGRKRRRRRVLRKIGATPPESAAKTGKKQKVKKRAADAPADDDVSRIKDEAKRQATKAAVNSLAEKAGVADAVEAIKEQGKELWGKTEKLSESVREKVPDDLSERVGDSLSEAGRAIKDGANRLSERVKAAVVDDDVEPKEVADGVVEDDGEDLAAKVGRGLKGFARWVEGPGAPEYGPNYEAAPDPSRVKPIVKDADDADDAVDAVDAVDAKEPAPQPELKGESDGKAEEKAQPAPHPTDKSK